MTVLCVCCAQSLHRKVHHEVLEKFKNRSVLFPLSDQVTLWKLIVASYIGFLLVALFGFRATSSISVSAIMTIPYGSTVSNTRVYIRKRMLAQVIGVIVAYPLYCFFLWAEFVPVSQRMALPMTLSLVITAFINRKFKLKIADITMLIPGYLVILMTPGYSLYPVMRPIYVLLGIFIGYALNVFFFAPHYGKIIDAQLHTVRTHLQPIMNGGPTGMLTPAQREELNLAAEALQKAVEYMPRLKQDLHQCKKYQDYINRMEYLEQRFLADEAAIYILREAMPLEDNQFAQEYQGVLQELFSHHEALFLEEVPDSKELTCPLLASPHHVFALAGLVRYIGALSCSTATPVTV